LPEQDGHCIFYQEVGNPKGEPVLVFHGGPGSQCYPFFACTFNLKKQRIIMFDQRGCGKSKFDDPLYKNTSQNTIDDALRLLKYLNISERIVCTGGSWGSTLALLFAETYPQKVKKIIVNCIFLGRRKDIENMTPIASYFYPDAVETVRDIANGQDLDKYYSGLLASGVRSNQEKAVQYYKKLEKTACDGSLTVNFSKGEISDKDILKFSIFMHYKCHNYFLKENQLLLDIKKIKNIPTEIYQNRLDFCCPPYQAFELYQSLSKAKFFLIPDRGHGSDMLFYEMYKNNLS
jgi:proline iminopeptidase